MNTENLRINCWQSVPSSLERVISEAAEISDSVETSSCCAGGAFRLANVDNKPNNLTGQTEKGI
jgi:hypothetical protein